MGRGAPHHEGVLAVVLVVAAAQPGGAKALAFVQPDREAVGAAHLERVAGRVVIDTPVELGEQAPGGDAPTPGKALTATFMMCQTVS